MAEELLDYGKFANLPWCEVPSWYLRSLAFGNTDKNGKEWAPSGKWGGRAKAELFRREKSGESQQTSAAPPTEQVKKIAAKPSQQTTSLVSLEEHLSLVARVFSLEKQVKDILESAPWASAPEWTEESEAATKDILPAKEEILKEEIPTENFLDDEIPF